jgi:hypothetical protein
LCPVSLASATRERRCGFRPAGKLNIFRVNRITDEGSRLGLPFSLAEGKLKLLQEPLTERCLFLVNQFLPYPQRS